MKVVDLILFHNFEKIGHFRIFQQILGFFLGFSPFLEIYDIFMIL